MSCTHISERIPGATPLHDGKFFIGDLRCKNCKTPMWMLFGMTREQLEQDKEKTYLNEPKD